MYRTILFLALAAATAPGAKPADIGRAERTVHISWGHQRQAGRGYEVSLTPANGARVESVTGLSLETGETEHEGIWQTRAGAGDVDGVDVRLSYPAAPPPRIEDLHIIWSDLISASDAETARRLSTDPAMLKNPAKLTVSLNRQGTAGFTVAMEQLAAEKAIWIPSLGVYLTDGSAPVPFGEHMKALMPFKGRRILDQVNSGPEANYDQYASRWEDMANVAYTNPEQRGPGHIVGLSWDSAIPKFGIDRGSGVWSDYGNPDQFQLWFGFGDLSHGLVSSWKGQHLDDGLPVVETTIERDGIRYEVQQFAYPLEGPPKERRGDIAMVLFEKVRMTDLSGHSHAVPISLHQRRRFQSYGGPEFYVEQRGSAWVAKETAFQHALFLMEGPLKVLNWAGTKDYQKQQKRMDVFLSVDVPGNGSVEFVLKLPSPQLSGTQIDKLASLDYSKALEATRNFWTSYLDRGTKVTVPEAHVNELFRANLWHALRLPRRHGGEGPGVSIDLPYSNFAYSQTGTPWPVNQSVYVDYMLYDLRGYHAISLEELLAQFRNNQESDGHLTGIGNWVAYTPGMLYAAGQYYLLSGDRTGFEKLLPDSFRALDWCLKKIREGLQPGARVNGLVFGPLNDLTGDGWWAFNQAYVYAGLNVFGKALRALGNPRAEECLAAASAMKKAIEVTFQQAATRSTIVPLRDRSWIRYVPSEVTTPRRLMEQWYPADVDTGPTHLIRLKAIDANSELADSLLHDHEDNLYYREWGIANEPVYDQQGTAYILRDDPAAAIRTFYSLMASGFSQSDLEPVEHRWTHGQYFGPPSTDGAWFELYRNMLIHESDDGGLVLGLATPRAWLADGKEIDVQNAPTYYGDLSMHLRSDVSKGQIRAEIETPARTQPSALMVRLRHPNSKAMKSVTVNGQRWNDFDVRKEWVRIPNPVERHYTVVASY
jgi:hypothetical protein